MLRLTDLLTSECYKIWKILGIKETMIAGWWGRAPKGKDVAFVNCILFKVCAEQWKHSLHGSSLVPSVRMQGCYSSAPYDCITIPVMPGEGFISYQGWKCKGQNHFSQFVWLVFPTLCQVFQSKLEGWLGLVCFCLPSLELQELSMAASLSPGVCVRK